MKSGETAANIARELAEQTRNHLNAGDITYSVRAMDQLVGLLDVQLRNLTPGGKDSAARSLNKVRTLVTCIFKVVVKFILDIKKQQKIVVTYNVNIYQPKFVAFCFKCIALLSNRKVLKATNFNAWMMFPSGF